MATKRKRATAPSTPEPDATSQPIELVVRRGALWRFNTLKKKTAELPVKVLWDRRQADRRTEPHDQGAQRRATDRRQAPPFTWEVADFVVVGPAPASDAGEKKKAAPRKPAARPSRARKA
jgi:hypothetical protein